MRKPIFILRTPIKTQQERDDLDKSLKSLKEDYHIVVIEQNPCEMGRSAYRVTYDLLNGTFWNYLYLWWNRKNIGLVLANPTSKK